MRIAHLSDLHFGHHDARLAEGLADEISRQSPDLVVVSGDFAQVGSAEEFETARHFLDQLSVPVFAVPGNHDLPAQNLLLRFLNPYGRYRRYVDEELEPLLEMDGVVLAGIKTSRRLRLGLNWAHGSISRGQLARLEARLSAMPAHKLRVVVAHHPLMQPQQPMIRRMQLVKRADLALATFARLGVRLVLSGHFHMSYMREHAVVKGETTGAVQSSAGPVLVVQAASAISTRLRGDRNAYNVIDIEEGLITVSVREWNGDAWGLRANEPSVPVETAKFRV